MLSVSRRALLSTPAIALAQNSPAPPERRLLASRVSPDLLSSVLVPRAQWRPYPTATQREPWQTLPAALSGSIVSAAEKQLGQPWPSLPASVFLDFSRNGNRSRFEALSQPRRARLARAALAECIENRGRFLDDILDGIWFICEESFWGVPAHIGAQKAGNTLPDVSEPIVDLFAAETSNTLAWVDYLLASKIDSLSKVLRPRIHAEIRRRVLSPCLARDDFWWLGFGRNRAVNNWNPWINSNWLSSVLLIEDDSNRRTAAVDKIIRSLDRFLDSYHDDGGCDEGPGYWSRAGASLFDCLELLRSATAAKLDYYELPLIRAIGAYIYRAHIAGRWYVNFADASAQVRPSANLVWRYGRRVQDPLMEAHGAWLASEAHDPLSLVPFDAMGRALDTVFHFRELSAAASSARPPLVAGAALPGIQVFTARIEQGSSRGFYIAAQGGHNAESHNHNDVGNFIVFCGGEPLFIDVGVETYTARTFSSRRYEIWTMQSAWHNCPTINGVMQGAGRAFQARNFSPFAAAVSMDIQDAYPPEAGVPLWHRELSLDRAANSVTLRDSFRLTRRNSVEWNFITTRAPRLEVPGRIRLDGLFSLAFDPVLSHAFDEHPSTDARLQPIWGATVRRIRLTLSAPEAQGVYTFTIRQP